MWLKTQHNLLKTIQAADAAMASAEDLVRMLQHSNDRTLKRWLANLLSLGLIRREDTFGYYRLTDLGRRVAKAPFVPAARLQLLRTMHRHGKALSIEEINPEDSKRSAADLNILRTKVNELRRKGYVSTHTAYHGDRFRSLYSLTGSGQELLVAYDSLKI